MTPRLAIGVMGSASGTHEAMVLARCNALGRTIAERGCTLITGACPGLSYAAVEGARAVGGLIVGISPGRAQQLATPRRGHGARIGGGCLSAQQPQRWPSWLLEPIYSGRANAEVSGIFTRDREALAAARHAGDPA
jgi:hypothetical protein